MQQDEVGAQQHETTAAAAPTAYAAACPWEASLQTILSQELLVPLNTIPSSSISRQMASASSAGTSLHRRPSRRTTSSIGDTSSCAGPDATSKQPQQEVSCPESQSSSGRAGNSHTSLKIPKLRLSAAAQVQASDDGTSQPQSNWSNPRSSRGRLWTSLSSAWIPLSSRSSGPSTPSGTVRPLAALILSKITRNSPGHVDPAARHTVDGSSNAQTPRDMAAAPSNLGSTFEGTVASFPLGIEGSCAGSFVSLSEGGGGVMAQSEME